jgi:hypothetical protein
MSAVDGVDPVKSNGGMAFGLALITVGLLAVAILYSMRPPSGLEDALTMLIPAAHESPARRNRP